jgi:acyl-CoA synthetase (AMP-forming)/AMP-acid ligase II
MTENLLQMVRPASVVGRFRDVARMNADKPFCLLHEGETVTFAEALQKAEAFAAAFHARGIRPGQIVALMLPTRADAAAAFFGAMMMGAIPAFFPPLSAKQDAPVFWASHGTLFRRIAVALVISDAANIDLIAQFLPDFVEHCFDINAVTPAAAFRADAETEIACLQHSSGTTGLKKGVVLTHKMLLDHIDNMAGTLAITPADKIISWLPLYHDMGLIACLILPALLGLTVVTLDPFAWVRRPATFLDAISFHKPTLCWLPNFAFQLLIRTANAAARYDLSSVRLMIDCSEPCKAETLRAFQARFAEAGLRPGALQISYAMAEAVFMVTQTDGPGIPRCIEADAAALEQDGLVIPSRPDRRARTIISCGMPMHGVDIRILDIDGQACAERIVGEIVIASATLFAGYYGIDTPSAKLQNGWYRTGDRGFIDGGALFVTGRNDDLLIINGKNIYAHDVEFCINTHCQVKAGRVVAVAPFNPRTGSQALVVIAETETADKAEREALVQAIRQTVNAEFAVSIYEAMLVDPGWLVKTTSGKISRSENVARYIAARPALQETIA